MQVIPEENPLTEHFSFAEITWKIRNISIALCPLSYRIGSEEFLIIGSEDTSWRLFLETSYKHNTASLYLRLTGPKQEFRSLKRPELGLSVTSYANILDSNGEQSLKYEKQFFFNFEEINKIETFDLTDILGNLSHSGPDDLTIKCVVLIEHGQRVAVPADVPFGLIELANTFEKLVNEPVYPDIQISASNRKFFINREMLSNVESMKKFKDLRYKEVKLLNYCEYSLASIFMYVYSGNIIHIISCPRISVAEDIERLVIPELFGAYPKERISLGSTIEVREFTAFWSIRELELMEDTLNGPEFNVDIRPGTDGTNTRWKICMYPQGKINGNVQEKKYVFIEATLLESIGSPINVNIEFCSLSKNEVLYSRRGHKRMEQGEKLEIPFFIRDGSLMKKCLTDGNLSLRITLWISTEEVIPDTVEAIHSHPFTRTNSISLPFFSKKMGKILADQRNCDLALVSKGVLFPVHKFVLASRCSFFRCRISNLYRQVITLPDFKKQFIRVLLEYLYTGLYSDMGLEANCHMYEFGFLFKLKRLQERCREEIKLDPLKIFEYAHDNNLPNLREEAFQYIANEDQNISDRPDWIDFFERRKELGHFIAGHWE